MEKNLSRYLVASIVCIPALFIGGAYAGTEYVKTQSHKSSLVVLEDRGGESVKGYFPGQKDAAKRINERAKERRSTQLRNSQYPIVTTRMRVGRVTEAEAEGISYQMASTPMFIVGFDSVSMSWLETNKSMLAEKKAIGLVVNVASAKEMEMMRQRVGGNVLLQPTQGDELAEHLKISHYPFYMDNEGVMR